MEIEMEYEIKKLMAKNDQIFTTDGEFIGSVSMTRRASELLDNDGWDHGEESWINYRKRTEKEREDEKQKRISFVFDLVTAYNIMMKCD